MTAASLARGLLADPGSTERTRVRRVPELAVTDRSTLYRVLDAGFYGHLAVADETGQPYALPIAYAREGDVVLFHGSSPSRLLRGFLSKALFDAGLYCRADDRGDPVVQLAPPLIIGQPEFDEIEQILRSVLTEAWTRI